jgi:hypothetical protein
MRCAALLFCQTLLLMGVARRCGPREHASDNVFVLYDHPYSSSSWPMQSQFFQARNAADFVSQASICELEVHHPSSRRVRLLLTTVNSLASMQAAAMCDGDIALSRRLDCSIAADRYLSNHLLQQLTRSQAHSPLGFPKTPGKVSTMPQLISLLCAHYRYCAIFNTSSIAWSEMCLLSMRKWSRCLRSRFVHLRGAASADPSRVVLEIIDTLAASRIYTVLIAAESRISSSPTASSAMKICELQRYTSTF